MFREAIRYMIYTIIKGNEVYDSETKFKELNFTPI